MTYQDNFVAEIKHKGRILRVRNGYVTLPFGSEYSILFKNLNTRNVAINVEVDGQDVLDNKRLVLAANQTTELQGFMNGNAVRNRFKFIEKTEQIMKHRGDRIDDGFIRVEFAFEEEEPVRIRKIINEVHEHHHHHHNDWWWYRPRPFWSNSGDTVTYSSSDNISLASLNDAKSCDAPENVFHSVTMDSLDTPVNDMGITVKGSEMHQEYRYATLGKTDPPQSMIIRLRGTHESGAKVSEPVTVQTKLQCGSCGTKSKSSAKYCSNCGTFLE